jgi:hypothetical protein
LELCVVVVEVVVVGATEFVVPAFIDDDAMVLANGGLSPSLEEGSGMVRHGRSIESLF